MSDSQAFIVNTRCNADKLRLCVWSNSWAGCSEVKVGGQTMHVSLQLSHTNSSHILNSNNSVTWAILKYIVLFLEQFASPWKMKKLVVANVFLCSKYFAWEIQSKHKMLIRHTSCPRYNWGQCGHELDLFISNVLFYILDLTNGTIKSGSSSRPLETTCVTKYSIY